MEKRYKVGLIGALIFAFFTLLLHLGFNISLLRSEGISLGIALLLSVLVYRLMK